MNKRLGSLILCMLLIVAQLFSFAFILHASNHECIGKDCPICDSISECIQIIRLLSLTYIALVGSEITRYILENQWFFKKNRWCRATLVQLKVKLSC